MSGRQDNSASPDNAGRSVLGAATTLIDYHSTGHCLLIAEAAGAFDLLQRLAPLNVTVLQVSSERTQILRQATDSGVSVISSGRPQVSGYLGAFEVQLPEQGQWQSLAALCRIESGYFDLILDLSTTPLIESALPPFGYYKPQTPEQLEQTLLELPELTGDFDKPRYFAYNADICAHSRSALQACRRCIDVCATTAIRSAGDGVSVNPYLCQGCGSCATVCPGGALSYVWPRTSEAISRTRSMRERQSDAATVLLLYSSSDDEDSDVAFEASLPDYVLAVAVEEVHAYGIDYWAAMLAAGLRRIVVVLESLATAPATLALQQQAQLLDTVLGAIRREDGTAALNSPAVVIAEANSAQLDDCLQQSQSLPVQQAAGPHFATHNDKRQTFRLAIDQLRAGHTVETGAVTLAAGSPFGQVCVDTASCTLCMACVSVCPAAALLDGQDLPRLRFIESHCLQCGLCQQACPEQAISLQPRFVFDGSQARQAVTLHQEQPFHCITCHKAFATQKIIDTLGKRLAGHWMFSDDKALRRLKMCEDCRVKDMFSEQYSTDGSQ